MQTQKEKHMKKLLILFLILVSAVSWAEEIEAPAEVDVYGALSIPGFGIGPMADFVYFPWSIDVGGGRYNHLGFGGSAGFQFFFGDGLAFLVPVEALFMGRFEMFEKFPFDFDARLGFLIGSGVVFCGATNFYFFIGDLRIGAGVTFYPNPGYDVFDQYSDELLVFFMLSAGYRFKLSGFKGQVLN